MYQYINASLETVWLANGFERQSTPNGNAVIIHDLAGLTRATRKAFIRQPAPSTGIQFRYIRQAMLMSQASLGKSMGRTDSRTDQAIAGWEKSAKIPKCADTLLRVLYAAALACACGQSRLARPELKVKVSVTGVFLE